MLDVSLPDVSLPDLSLVTGHGGHRILVEVDEHRFETPPVEHLVFYAGLGALAAIHVIPPPVALAIGVGHALIDLTRRPVFQEVGEVLEAAA